MILFVNKEVFVKYEQAQTTPNSKWVWFSADFEYIFFETATFDQFDIFWSDVVLPKLSKGTSTDQDLSFESITKSL